MDDSAKTDLQKRVEANLAQVHGRISQLKWIRTILITVMLGTGLLSALLAGLSGVTGGPVIGSGDAGWGLTCLAAAGLTLAGTLASGANEQFHVSETLDKARSCAGRLNALHIALTGGSLATTDAVNKYADVVAEYPSVLG